MPFYLVTDWVDLGPSPQGRDRRRRAPRGYDRGGNYIVLDDTAVLLWVPDTFTDQRAVILGTDKSETLATATRSELTKLTSDREYRGTQRLDATIFDLLRHAPTGRWNPLRPSKQRQRYEVFLGPGGRGRNLLATEPVFVPPSTQNWVDDFNRANANLLGSTSSDSNFTWSEAQGVALTIVSNQVQFDPSSGEFAVAAIGSDLDSVDTYSQAELTSWNRSANHLAFGVGVRGHTFTGAGGTNSEGYYAEVGNNSGTSYRELRTFDDDTVLDSDATATTSGTLYIEIDGSSITVKHNSSTILTATNTEFTTGKRTCVTCYTNTNANDLTWDNFATGDLAAGGGAATPKGVLGKPLYGPMRRVVF